MTGANRRQRRDGVDPAVRGHPEPVFETVVLPVASEADAHRTCAATLPHLSDHDSSVVVVHVIERRSWAPDKAPLAARRAVAERVFEITTDRFRTADIPVKTRLLYGTDIAETILDAADDVDATAIVVTPRGANRWLKLLTGDVTTALLAQCDCPVLVVRHPDDR